MAYRASSLRGLAIAQMVFGALMLVFGIASIAAVDRWISHIAFGIWVGIWVLITGILGYIGAKDDSTPNKCLIGCFMGFSITTCVLTGIMFITYCVALAGFNEIIRCRNSGYDWNYNVYYNNRYCYSSSYRHTAAVGLGLGSCMLIFTIVEFILALSSSIYCCNAVCCNASTGAVNTVHTVTNQQVMYVQQPQPTFAGGQGGVVIIQPNSAVTTTTRGYPVAAQPPMHFPQQPPVHMPMQQPPYWASPPGPNPAGSVPVNVTYAAAAGIQQPPQQPPPYSYMQTGNAPPLAGSSGETPSEALPVDV